MIKSLCVCVIIHHLLLNNVCCSKTQTERVESLRSVFYPTQLMLQHSGSSEVTLECKYFVAFISCPFMLVTFRKSLQLKQYRGRKVGSGMREWVPPVERKCCCFTSKTNLFSNVFAMRSIPLRLSLIFLVVIVRFIRFVTSIVDCTSLLIKPKPLNPRMPFCMALVTASKRAKGC